jgi:hypothetical protein
MRRLGLRIPLEMLGQLRFGRGLDNRKLKASGFGYRYTSREAVIALAEYMRLHPVMRGAQEPYRYEREVEDFLRWSPHVKSQAYRPQPRLSASETDELSRLSSAHAERTGTMAGGSSVEQAEALVRAAKQDAEERDAAASLSDPDGEDAPPEHGEPAAAQGAQASNGEPIERYDDLEPEEVVSLLGSMDSDDLLALRDHERSAGARPRIIAAIDGVLARREAAQRG